MTALVRPVLRVLRGLTGVLIGLVLLGNAAIQLDVRWARTCGPPPENGLDLRNFRVVAPLLWRGGFPDAAGYRLLAEHGVVTVVDLRAEARPADHAAAVAAGLTVVHLPVRDGQRPRPGQVGTFTDVMTHATAPVYVHCGQGVGRTGAMIGAWATSTGRTPPGAALRDMLAVGPPTAEQLAAVHPASGHAVVGALVTGTSRLVDAPRRLAAHLRR